MAGNATNTGSTGQTNILTNNVTVINATGGTGAGAMTTLLAIFNPNNTAVSNSTEVNVFGLSAASSSVTNILVDQLTSTTLPTSTDSSLSYYILGRGTGANRTRVTSSPNAASVLQNSLQFSGTGVVNVSANAAGGNITLASGLDGTSSQGNMTLRSGDILSGSMAVSGGGTTVRGGNNGSSSTSSTAGNTLAAGLSTAGGGQGLIQVQISKIATNALTGGQLVKLGTANPDRVLMTGTLDTTNFIGFAALTVLAGAAVNVIVAGEVPNAILGTGSCSLANFVIIDTTTSGDIQCTTTAPAAGRTIGWAESAQSTVGVRSSS